MEGYSCEKPEPKTKPKRSAQQSQIPGPTRPHTGSDIPNPARIYAAAEQSRCLDPTQLAKLEQAFRSWSEASSRADVRASRKRIILIFLLIRYTGARTSARDEAKRVVRYGDALSSESWSRREVQISEELMREIQRALSDQASGEQGGAWLQVDAAHVRRKFYERAAECGLAQDLASPNAIRRARAVELMHNNVPLPVVQRILGNSTPNLTASLVAFSDEDIHQVARHFIEKESRRKTSARNTFFGKIGSIRKGDIQSRVDVVTVGGDVVSTVITNNSLKRMGLKKGSLVTAEVKAPWLTVEKSPVAPVCTAENIFHGTVIQVVRGKLTTEFVVLIPDGTELCSLVTEESRRKLNIQQQDEVWVMFNTFAVILHVD